MDSGVVALAAPPAAERPATDRVPVSPVLVGLCGVMVASFLFETPHGAMRYQLPSLAAALFLAGTALELRACYGRISAALLWFFVFLYVFAASSVLHGWIVTWDMARRFLFLVQAVFVFWAVSNLMSDEKVARKLLGWFVIACVVRAALPFLGIGRTAYEERWTGGERITAFGQDANFSATLLAAGLVTLIGLTYGRSRSALRPRVLAWPLVALLGVAILDSGSRGGLLALAAGLLAFMFRHTERLGSRLRHVLGAVVAITILGVGAMQSEVMRGRVQVTTTEGSLAGREKMFPALWNMFLEKPLAGWGPQRNQYELATRAPFLDRAYRDSHNLFLELLTATGLVGALPFLVALGLCTRAAWLGRRGAHGILPFALVVLFLIANLSIDMFATKPFWVALALSLASGPPVHERP